MNNDYNPVYEPTVRGIEILCGKCGSMIWVIKDTIFADYPKSHIFFCSRCGCQIKWEVD